MITTVNAKGIKQLQQQEALKREVRVKRNGWFAGYGPVCAGTIIAMLPEDADAGIANGMLEPK